MTTETFDILIIGPQGPIEEVLNHLEQQEKYRLHFCPDFYAARASLSEHIPTAIIVALRRPCPCERTLAHAIEWLETLRNVTPVLVFCPFADLQFYKNVMDHGAFDFFTPSTPLEEIDRELNNAVNWRAFQVA